MARPLLALLVGVLVAASAAPAAHAGDLDRPRLLSGSSCSTVKVGARGYVLFRHGLSCAVAKRLVRQVAETRGRRKPRGWSCSSGSRFRRGAYCERGGRHFGWEVTGDRSQVAGGRSQGAGGKG